jgi:hypothetical protein
MNSGPHQSSSPGSDQQCRLVIGAGRKNTGGEQDKRPHPLTAGFEILPARTIRRADKSVRSRPGLSSETTTAAARGVLSPPPLQTSPHVSPGGGACPGGQSCATVGGGAGGCWAGLPEAQAQKRSCS